jgi:hypothetical protein
MTAVHHERGRRIERPVGVEPEHEPSDQTRPEPTGAGRVLGIDWGHETGALVPAHLDGRGPPVHRPVDRDLDDELPVPAVNEPAHERARRIRNSVAMLRWIRFSAATLRWRDTPSQEGDLPKKVGQLGGPRPENELGIGR